VKFLVLFFFLFSFTASAFDSEGNSGIKGPSYEKIKSDLSALSKTHPENSAIFTYGKTKMGEDLMGILLVKKGINPKKLVLITEVTHGDEYLNIADRLPVAFLEGENSPAMAFVERGGAIAIIPILNPDGYKLGQRENANNVDLNRDFSIPPLAEERFTQIESNNLAKWVDGYLNETGADLTLTFDYHCCFCDILFSPWSHTRTLMPENDRQSHGQLGNLMTQFFPKLKYGAASELSWALITGSSLDYWYSKYQPRSLAFEGCRKTEASRFDQHHAWWKSLFELL